MLARRRMIDDDDAETDHDLGGRDDEHEEHRCLPVDVTHLVGERDER